MRKDLKNVTREEARKTALVVGAVLISAGLWFVYRGRMTVVVALMSAAGILIFFGLFVPPAAKLFHRIWMTIAFALGYVNSRIILTLVYLFVFVPYRILSRIFGRDPLDIRTEQRSSYWHKREKTRPEREQFERLF